ncbi:hypothetical protein [Streptosporangium sp. H16]
MLHLLSDSFHRGLREPVAPPSNSYVSDTAYGGCSRTSKISG